MLRLRIAVLTLAPLLAAAAAACGSPKTAAGPTQSPQAAASAPAATTTPGPTPPSPPQAEGTVVGVTPVVPGAAGIAVARTDCPASWVTWRDVTGVVSFCTPSGMFGASGALAGGGGITVASELNGKSNTSVPKVAISVSVTDKRGAIARAASLAQFCQQSGIPKQISGEEVHMAVAGLAAAGCHYVGYGNTGAANARLESLRLEASLAVPPAQPARFLQVIDNWVPDSAGAQPLAYQILNTIKLER